MNHIRGFFRPSATRISGNPAVGHPSKSKSSSSTSADRKSRNSPKPHNRRNSSPVSGGDGGTARAERHGSSTSSATSSTALDHLYEKYCDNISAGERKSQSSERKPCMVMREFSDDYIAPMVSDKAVFLPREYDIVGDDEEEEDSLIGAGDASDVLTRTQATTTTMTMLLKDDHSATTSATVTAVGEAPESCCCSGGDEGNTYAGAVDGAPSQRNLLTTSKVLALNSDDESPASVRGGSSANAPHRSKPSSGQATAKPLEMVRSAQQVTPPGQDRSSQQAAADTTTAQNHTSLQSSNRGSATDVTDAAKAEAPESSQVRRYSVSSWSFVEDEAKIHGRVRRVVVPLAPGLNCGEDTNFLGGGAAHRPSEVEVVRLNDALFTSSELARWRQYQVARMGSFLGASNDVGTPSTSTRSRDAPSSNSASGPEFMPMLGVANIASETSERCWEDFGEEGDAHMGVPAPKGRLIRVCYVSEINDETRRRRSAQLPPSSPPARPTPAQPSATYVVTSSASHRFPHQQANAGAKQLNEHHRSNSVSSSVSGSSSSRSCSDANDTTSDDASSVTSGSASRSPSATSLDADGAVIPDTGSTTAPATASVMTRAVTHLPSIFRKGRMTVNRGKGFRDRPSAQHDGSSGSSCSDGASSQGVLDDDRTPGELHPLPPVSTRPHGSPGFRLRVLH
jgi:hypothetical protein